MTHHNHSIGKSILNQLEKDAGSIDSESSTDVLIASLAISMKRIADLLTANSIHPVGVDKP